ncbi:TrmH family RNA methyltransferase [Senegalia sp. (in: firmicutes)]|uniref:TrmH family RNA methyltransferase n=1 Tax=Senegalia sp. (in: firmicutes) TaxID=1924098 RepID=UPI003F9DAA3F
MNKEYILEGKLSIEAAIKAKSRRISKIYIDKDKDSRRVREFEKWLGRKGIKTKKVDESLIDDMTKGKTHGGIIAIAGEKNFVSLEKLIKGKENPFIVMLDGIEDPYNFGYAVRSLYLAGVDGVVVNPRNWMEATSIVAKASAGTTELMDMAVAEDISSAAEFFKGKGLEIAATSNKNSVSLYDVDFKKAIFLLIGGEKRGITRSFLDKVDTIISIPYGRSEKISLAATSATSVLAFEMMRQRKYL